MQKTLVTIVALSVDTRHAVLYKEDGSTLSIPQGDARLPRIVEQSKFELSHGTPVEVDITPIAVQRTEFTDAEKGTKGVVKFFRVAKSFLKSLVNTESPEKVDEAVAHVSPLDIGVFPGMYPGQPKEDGNQGTKEEDAPADPAPAVADAAAMPNGSVHPADMSTDQLAEELKEFAPKAEGTVQDATNRQPEPAQTNDQKLDAARARMQQLVGNSVGTDRTEFHTPLNEETETIVAVHEKSGAIIPDAHKLARQLRSAQKLQDYAGFEKFVERLAAIIDERGHSVEDLMKFIEKGDLPIADDGSIVIYKRLKNMGEHFVDVHSGNIRQKVGSFVFMKAGLVDPNRRQDCSNGLHVASLSYLGGFSGDVTIMAKVRPEDVFAVPMYAHNKMRVSGYHILHRLSDTLARLVNGGGSISSDPDGARLLNEVLRGHHIGITQYVEVGGHNGSKVTYTDADASIASNAALLPVATAMALGKAETLNMDEPIEPKAPVAPDVKATDLVSKPDENLTTQVIINIMSNSLEKGADKAESTTKPTLAQQAEALYSRMLNATTADDEKSAAQALRELKQKARKGWTALGLPAETGDEIAEFLDEGKSQEKPVQAEAQVKAKTRKQVTVTPVSATEAGKDTLGGNVKEAVTLLKAGKLSNIEIARKTGLSKDQIYRLKKKHCS